MINPSTNQRELAYIVTIDEIRAIENYDRIEHARVGGWWIVVRKDQFKVGDFAIYIEIDSKVPVTPAFEFLEKKHYAVKTQKFCKGQAISQGLLMSPEDFGWKVDKEIIWDDESNVLVKGSFVTEKLGITYYEPEDNTRKANPEDKYKKMAQRRPKLFKTRFARWMMKREWGKKVMFFFFGKKKDKNATSFPTHFPYIKKTDQERVENMAWVLEDKTPYIKTQKCDGSSGTFILERKGKKKFEFYVCSRNVRQLTPEQKCFYDDNYYWNIALKYNIEMVLRDLMIKHPEWKYCCLQGEICAPGIQKNPHGLTQIRFNAFHFTDSEIGRWDIREMKKMCEKYNIPVVPIVDENYILPNDIETLKLDAEYFYAPECCEGKETQKAEGYVYYKTTDPNFSFKNVSREYLLKNS